MLGFYDAYQTHGIPLSILISVARERRIVPSWVDEVESMERHGIKRARAVSMLCEALDDSSFDPERVEQTKIRLQRLSA
jgi:hypothetical protein